MKWRIWWTEIIYLLFLIYFSISFRRITTSSQFLIPLQFILIVFLILWITSSNKQSPIIHIPVLPHSLIGALCILLCNTFRIVLSNIFLNRLAYHLMNIIVDINLYILWNIFFLYGVIIWGKALLWLLLILELMFLQLALLLIFFLRIKVF